MPWVFCQTPTGHLLYPNVPWLRVTHEVPSDNQGANLHTRASPWDSNLNINLTLRGTVSITASTSASLVKRTPPPQRPLPAFCFTFSRPAGTQENSWKSLPGRGNRLRSHGSFPCGQDSSSQHSIDIKLPFPTTGPSGFQMHSGHLWVESTYKIQGSSSGLHEFTLHLLLQTINIVNNSGPRDGVLRRPSINLSPL